jgi:hypothetical protein
VTSAPSERIVVHHSTATFAPEEIGSPKRTRTSDWVAVTSRQYARTPSWPTLGGRKGEER